VSNTRPTSKLATTYNIIANMRLVTTAAAKCTNRCSGTGSAADNFITKLFSANWRGSVSSMRPTNMCASRLTLTVQLEPTYREDTSQRSGMDSDARNFIHKIFNGEHSNDP
jgi:hypothetical protein